MTATYDDVDPPRGRVSQRPSRDPVAYNIAEWDAGIRRARDTGMIYAPLYFVVAGTTP